MLKYKKRGKVSPFFEKSKKKEPQRGDNNPCRAGGTLMDVCKAITNLASAPSEAPSAQTSAGI